MNILHVIATLAARSGGPAKACVEMTRALAKRGHTVTIITTNQGGTLEMNVPEGVSEISGAVEIKCYPSHFPRFWKTSLPMAKALGKMIQEVDIVHIHSLYLFHNMVAGHYCRKYNIPYIIRPHGTLDPLFYSRHRYRKFLMEVLFENRNIKNADAIHFTAEEERVLAEQFTFGTPGVIAPNGLDINAYENAPENGRFRSLYPETGDKKIILFFGRINFIKGLDILTKAFAQIARARDDVHLVIAGPDNEGYSKNVKKWLNEEGVLEKVTFTGMLRGEMSLAAMNDAEMFTLPSYSENFGISAVEAMACGLPVVISDRIKIWREIKSDGAGIICPCDPARFAEAMTDLLDHPEKAIMMGRKGIASVRKRYQWSNVAATIEDIYKSIIVKHKKKA